MGFFSWKTSDTGESIANVYTGRCRPVYLLQPGNLPHIKEETYEGYGNFGGTDAHIWLAMTNATSLGIDISNMSDEAIRGLGIEMEMGDVLKDTETGDFWHVFWDARLLVPGHFFNGPYDQVIPEYGTSANALVANGRFVKVPISQVIEIPYPLKFSFDKNAIYEDLPAASDCPYQGYFFDDVMI